MCALANIPKDKILEIVRFGPTFPSKIAKTLGNGADTMLVGAILSTLISTGDIRVSTVKIGGTPLYYVPEQEFKLEEFITYLNEKDKTTFRLLKEQKVLQDSTQEPLIRVSLRAIKDFAKSFELNYQNKKILFWRFYNLTKEEAETLAKSIIDASIEEEKTIEQENKIRTISNTNINNQSHTPLSEIIKPKIEEIKDEDKENKELVEDKIESKMQHIIKKTEKKDKNELKDFYETVKTYITSKNLDIVSREKIKKTEYNLILKNHDTNEYIYCKAKDKKIISEGDLAPALIFAQNKKMTCLFIATGDLSKKAESMIHKDFSAMKFEKII
jgi:hypothetical protein